MSSKNRIEKLDLEKKFNTIFVDGNKMDMALKVIQEKINEIIEDNENREKPFYLQEDDDEPKQ